MTHREFIEARQDRSFAAGIDPLHAMVLFETLSSKYQVPCHIWSWIYWFSIPVFIAIAIFVKWWLGLVLLFLVTPWVKLAVKQTAAYFVLEYAEENEEFYEAIVSRDLLIFNDVGDT